MLPLRAQLKAPNSQSPSSKETPSSKLKNRSARRLPRHLILKFVFEIWNFSGAWGLVLGVFSERRLKNSDAPGNTR